MRKKVDIKKIKSNNNNPRTIHKDKFDKLVKSLKEFPEMLEKRPLVVDENMMVLGGNMRLKALEEAGVTQIPIDVAEGWTEKQKQEFIIKDNVGFGQWDWEIIANEWDTKELNEWGLDVWDEDDLNLDDFFKYQELEENLININLKFNKDDGTLVKQELQKINKKLEDALWQLLKL